MARYLSTRSDPRRRKTVLLDPRPSAVAFSRARPTECGGLRHGELRSLHLDGNASTIGTRGQQGDLTVRF